MVYREGITTAITRYYVFNGIFREGEDTLTFDDADTNLVEVGIKLEEEFSGSSRKFVLELDNFDDENHYAEIIAGFTVWPYEDDDSEIVLIVKSIHDELERVGFSEDDCYYMADGPDIR
ncbi:MAG: hypothetical protein KAT16_01665 [Candidatus Heimdallarchaeota archaeon]|nr:hypothetical protein [Candidatus Heimdallarchaeota archaeon]